MNECKPLVGGSESPDLPTGYGYGTEQWVPTAADFAEARPGRTTSIHELTQMEGAVAVGADTEAGAHTRPLSELNLSRFRNKTR